MNLRGKKTYHKFCFANISFFTSILVFFRDNPMASQSSEFSKIFSVPKFKNNSFNVETEALLRYFHGSFSKTQTIKWESQKAAQKQTEVI